MRAFGIPFTNRLKSDDPPDAPTRNSAAFLAFAAACAAAGVSQHVKGVMYDGNWCGFDVDVDEVFDGTEVGDAISIAAHRTLPQSAVFGMVYHKGCGL